MRQHSAGKIVWSVLVAALVVGASPAGALPKPIAKPEKADKVADAKVVSDAGKADVDGARGLSVFGTTPLLLKATGPGKVRLVLKAKLPATAAVKYTVQVDFKQVEAGSLEVGADPKKAAGPEKIVVLTMAAGVHDISVAARGGDGFGRLAVPDILDDIAIPELEELPLEELAAKGGEAKKEEVKADKPVETAAAEPAPATGEPTWNVHLRPFAAVGTVRETGFSSPLLPGIGAASSQFQVGTFVLATRGPLSMLGEVRDGFYHRSYVTRWNGPDGRLPTLEQDEQNLALGFTVGWDIIHHIRESLARQLTVSPFAGPAARLLINDALPQSIVGIQLGARIDWAASDALVLGASGGWLGHWSFIQQLGYKGVPLLFGPPRSATDVRLDALVKLSGPAHLRVAWDTELVVLNLAYRSYQAMSVSVDYGF